MQQQTPSEPSHQHDVSVVLRRLGPAVPLPQLREFACACVHRVWPLLDSRLYPLVQVAERLAEGHASGVRRARALAFSVRRELQDGPASRWHAVGAVLHALQRVPSGWDDASAAVREAARERGSSWEMASATWMAERVAQGELLLSLVRPEAAA